VRLLGVALAALLTALATGLGALPFAFGSFSRRWLSVSNAVAAGFMLALLIEGGIRGWWQTLAGAAVGAAFIVVTERTLRGHDVEFAALRGVDARKGLLIVAVMTVHSFSEGVGLGVSYGGGASLGVAITIAIAIHNIPEGLAISLVLVPRGASVRSAAWWSIFSSLPQPLVAVPAYLFVETFEPFLPAGLGFAGGAMAWVVFAELLPAARDDLAFPRLVAWLGGSLLAMSLLQLVLLGH
jgi:zinc transporter ZupT